MIFIIIEYDQLLAWLGAGQPSLSLGGTRSLGGPKFIGGAFNPCTSPVLILHISIDFKDV